MIDSIIIALCIAASVAVGIIVVKQEEMLVRNANYTALLESDVKELTAMVNDILGPERPSLSAWSDQ